jgi:hypothetical protein
MAAEVSFHEQRHSLKAAKITLIPRTADGMTTAEVQLT